MRKAMMRSIAMTVAVGSCGIVLEATGGISEAGAAQHSMYASKAAFCGASIAIDRAGSSATSAGAFLSVLKAHKQDLTTMLKNAPSGSVGNVARQLVHGAESALAANNPSLLPTIRGGPVDTYCGVDGNGKRLPSYFSKGTRTAFCSNFLPIYQGVANASTDAEVLSAFTAHGTQVERLASETSMVPSSVRSAATTMVDTSRSIIRSKSVSSVQGLASSAIKLALYCGQNQ